MHFVIRQGLDLDLTGAAPRCLQDVEDALDITRVGIVPTDWPVLRPALKVVEGDRVVPGQLLFEDRDNPAHRVVAPVSGTVCAVRRGARRHVDAIVIERDGRDDRDDLHEELITPQSSAAAVDANPADVRELMVRSGLWTCFRQRPFGSVPTPQSTIT
jgi:Na+-transporting NADH:ubiquinone oxidoreductase subunit A